MESERYLITPIPTTHRRVRTRGYNQAQLLAEARRESGEAHIEFAEDALDIDGVIDNSEVNLAKAKSGFHQWLAGKRDRTFEPNQGAAGGLTFNIGELHLGALMRYGSTDQLTTTPHLRLTAGVEDAEVISIEEIL